MNQTLPYFTKRALIRANDEAISSDRNASLEPDLLEKLSDDFVFPVIFAFDQNDIEMRVVILLPMPSAVKNRPKTAKGWEGKLVHGLLDVPYSTFGRLPMHRIAHAKCFKTLALSKKRRLAS